jgi:hypothetical protein
MPTNTSLMRLHNPMSRVALQSRTAERDLKQLPRNDAPIARHPDADELYELLCMRIDDLELLMGDNMGRCKDWEGPARMLLGLV